MNTKRLPMNTEEIERAKTLKASGLSIHQIALTLKRDDKTIKKHLSTKEAIDGIEAQREDLADHFRSVAQRLVVSITDEDIRKSTALQRLTGAGICVDKARLLENLSTSNEQIIILNVPNTKEEYEDMLRRRNEIENND